MKTNLLAPVLRLDGRGDGHGRRHVAVQEAAGVVDAAQALDAVAGRAAAGCRAAGRGGRGECLRPGGQQAVAEAPEKLRLPVQETAAIISRLSPESKFKVNYIKHYSLNPGKYSFIKVKASCCVTR